MRTSVKISLFVAFVSMFGFMNAQNDNAKTAYIKNQDYLSASSTQSFKNVYGDSLKGFDENKVKSDILSHGFIQIENVYLLNQAKRNYINKKYSIGEYAPQPKLTQSVLPPQNSSPSNNSKTIGGGNQIINVAPCVNEDFELTPVGIYQGAMNAYAVAGWTIESRTNNGTCQSGPCFAPNNYVCNTNNNPWVLGSPEFEIVQTPLQNPFQSNNGATNLNACMPWLNNSPLGGNKVAHLKNTQTPDADMTRISTEFPVTPANTSFQFAYAGSWDGNDHDCCVKPRFEINMYSCGGNLLGCSSISLTPAGNTGACTVLGGATYSFSSNCSANGTGWTYNDWQVQYIDLSPYIGQCIRFEVMVSNCSATGHHGNLFLDAACGSGNPLCPTCVPPASTNTVAGQAVSYCAGSNVANIAAPSGYVSYMWGPPPGYQIPTGQCCVPVLTLSPAPAPGTIWTVTMTSQSGCLFVTTNTVAYTTVGVAGLASSPSCSNGASGSATVVGSGSSLGYNYVWKNSLGTTVGTQSTATGLAPGIYSVTLSGGLCGTTTETVEVGIGGFQMQTVLKPFCG
ncbi:MAG: hypothetical protein KF900_12255, partial [Bacteroidetes bacterium]|nr:hypothetical protein [Bacteroidota bacterium]